MHPWQRRLLTLSLAALAGLGGAMLAYPHVRDYRLIRRLASDDEQLRRMAIARAAALARSNSRFRSALEGALNTEDDRLFEAAAVALKRAESFHTPGRDALKVDRLRAIMMRTTRSAENPKGSAESRRVIFTDVLLSGRDNRYVRDALAAAAADDEPAIRAMSAALAGRLGDDGHLRLLLKDAKPVVSAAAALDAGLARRSELADDILKLMRQGPDPGVISCCAYALASMDPSGYSQAIAELLPSAADNALRDRLLHALAIAGTQQAQAAVAGVLQAAPEQSPPAAALLAAAKLKLHSAAPQVLAVLDAAASGQAVPLDVLRAALTAAGELGIPARRQAYAICRDRWGWPEELSLIMAVRLLADQIDAPQENAPTRQECIDLLGLAAEYKGPTTYPASRADDMENGRAGFRSTPMPSAAAAAALWKLNAPSAAQRVRHAAADNPLPAGVYLAWHIARGDGAAAMDLGLSMLPAADAPPELREFNDHVRAAGAMLLSLAADGEQEKAMAVQRITSRLVGGRLGGEDDLLVRGVYQCGLFTLGQSQHRQKVLELLALSAFPLRAAVTALCGAGDPEGLDRLLWNPRTTRAQLAKALVSQAIAEVVSAAAPDLPKVDMAACGDLLDWQIRILQDAWAIQRGAVKLGFSRR